VSPPRPPSVIHRWPIRLRLTAAFTVVMALVLTGVALGTVGGFQASFNESLDQDLTGALQQLQATGGPRGVVGAGRARPGVGVQVLDGVTGTVLGATPGLETAALLGPADRAAAAHGELDLDRADPTGPLGPVRVRAAPIPAAGTVAVAVAVVGVGDRDAAVADLGAELALALPLVLLVAAAGAYLLTAAALRPVEHMRARAGAITATDPDPQLPLPPADDEITRLGVTLNALLARQQTALARERQFTADAGHELRTPLSMLTTELELALRRPRHPDELTDALRSALQETDRLSRLANDLLVLTGTDRPHPADTPRDGDPVTGLLPVLEPVIARYRTHASAPDSANCEDPVALSCPTDLTARVDPDDLTRAVGNLLDNALHHGAPPITVTARPTTSGGHPTAAPTHRAAAEEPSGSQAGPDGPPWVHLEVRDHGPGIDPEFLPHALERFTRADPARTAGGAGLGLAITAALATRHGGTLTATNHPAGGAVITLTLPATAATSTPKGR